MSKNYLGEFEELVLPAINKLGPKQAYGLPIAEAIEKATGNRIAVGAIYTTLGRLQAKRFVRFEIGQPSGERGGRGKKLYALDSNGIEMLKSAEAARKSLS